MGANGKKGTHFEIPLSLGPMKKGKDAHGAVCSIFDFVVHPETVKLASGNQAVRGLLADTVSVT